MKKDIKKVSLLDKWKNRKNKEGTSLKIAKAPFSFSHALSNTQQRLWFLQQSYPNNTFYNLSEYYLFKGELNTVFLKESLNIIFDKHQILKSFYPTENDKAVLKIDNSKKLSINEADFSEHDENEAKSQVKKFINGQAQFNFDLSSSPLIKASILKISKTKHSMT